MRKNQDGAISFAEKVLELLDEGRYTATYKYAVLLSLIDVCLERTQKAGDPPHVLTTRQVADKIVELYWPHTVPFATRAQVHILKQNTTGQAEIVSAIIRFRERHAPDPSVPWWQSRMAASAAYERLVRLVEWKLIEMPLPRLQIMGQAPRLFIYEISWDRRVDRKQVTRYQNGQPSSFDNRVLLKPGVGEYLLQLAGLLRPLVQRRWAAMVAHLNRLEESDLEEFMFGATRVQTAKVRAGLWEIQERRCFYCGRLLREPTEGEVDHFVPWSRYPDDGLDNLVVADKTCNGLKSNSIAADKHLSHWSERFQKGHMLREQIGGLAQVSGWERHPDQSLSVARAIYARLPKDARLWLQGKEFIVPDRAMIATALDL